MTSQSASLPDLDHLKWSVDCRHEIQRTLLALYGYVVHNKPGHFPTTAVLDNCIAAAFSLWRAAFLTDMPRTVATVHQSQERFLQKVLTTNAINFSDDAASSAWSFGFYLQNASHRLTRGVELYEQYFDDKAPKDISGLLMVSGTPEKGFTRYQWECTHLALRRVFNLIAPIAFKLDEFIPDDSSEHILFRWEDWVSITPPE
jgi:hypothetical protein